MLTKRKYSPPRPGGGGFPLAFSRTAAYNAEGKEGTVLKKKVRPLAAAAALLLTAALGFLLYASVYYHADETALSALRPDGSVSVSRTDYGYWFDGPAEDAALIFYPGGKVEAEAYAPLLHRLATGGLDVCLVRMPLRFAFLGKDRASAVMEAHGYEHWYVGGHSLGGAVAALYAADNAEALDGLVLCAAYPTKPLDPSLTEVSLVGSEDGVLAHDKLEAGRAFAPPRCREFVLEGGNHALFGSYGPQRGDGEALLTPEEQWDESARDILEALARAA